MGRYRVLSLILAWGALCVACGDNAADDDDASAGTAAIFDLDADTTVSKHFFDLPLPSDLRLTADGRPDLTGFPNPKGIPLIDSMLATASDRRGFLQMPVVYLAFDGPLAPRVETDVIPADPTQPILLINLADGSLVPAVARTLTIDDYLPNPTLGVGPVPGFVLEGDTPYAVVVTRDANDSEGARLGVPAALATLAAGNTPAGPRGEAARAVYAPLWPVLDQLGVDRDSVAAATVFTTGDTVADVFALSEAVLGAYSVTIDNIALDPDDGADHDSYCELLATVDYPQFQTGTPPFNSGGLFDIGADGLPILQRTETAPVVIAIPKTPMPAAGYPLMLYFHGSGGVAATVVDRGPRATTESDPQIGLGPAHTVAIHGIASVGSALPLSPDRLPGASYTAYLNFNNLAAFRDTFRQGTIEQRLFVEALRTLEIPPEALAGCAGPILPDDVTAFSFDPDGLVASGQSMGGMYGNLVTAVEPRIRAVVPTGAGGFWSHMILVTDLLPGTVELISAIFGTPFEELTYMHPGEHLLEFGWEPAEPMVYMPRIAANPLPGHPVRPIYEPVGRGDVYFSIDIFDAAAVAYANSQVGEQVWDTMQPALTRAGLGGIAAYPATNNRTSADGTPYTGVVVQYESDGIDNAHYIYAQRDDVKYQWGCFLATFLATGQATVPAPAAPGTPCP